MKYKKINSSIGKLIMYLLMLMIVVVGGSFAWFAYQSNKSALVLSIGDINDSKVIINTYQLKETLIPSYTYNDEIYSQVTIINNNIDNMSVNLYYKINQLDEIVINNGLRYTIASSTSIDGEYTEIITGDFTLIENNNLTILDIEIEPETTIYYRIYPWIDTNSGNQITIKKSIVNLELNTNSFIKETYPDSSVFLTSYSCNNTSLGDKPYFTYTGDCEVIDDGDDDWRIKFLTSGTFTPEINVLIDAFLVGGGGGGGVSNITYTGGGGGGGGYTTTTFSEIKKDISYEIIIGSGGKSGTRGEETIAFGTRALGGQSGNTIGGGSGGSGGGGGAWSSDNPGATGGKNGANGTFSSGLEGVGQSTSTYEFGDSNLTLYSGGGGGGAGISAANDYGGKGVGGDGGGANGGRASIGESALDNTGGGGGGGSPNNVAGGTGGSGIVVIRNSKQKKLPFEFEYTGKYTIINDGDDNWRIKFLTSGTFTSNEDISVDAFLVGGGGGGGINTTTYFGGGGGGGGYTKTTYYNIKKNIQYEITIGKGGTSAVDGESTIAFESIANGGKAGSARTGGDGGSGGGKGGYSSDIAGGCGGSNGIDGTDEDYGGIGQNAITSEFGEETGMLYAGGGGGGGGISAIDTYGRGCSGGAGGGAIGGYKNTGGTAQENTGGGGGGGSPHNVAGGSGGSGIVVIRNSKQAKLPFEFEYTGNYAVINDENNNWRIKFFTSGTFTSDSDLSIDAFLVGGGGGGAINTNTYYAGGGGGGGYTTTISYNIKKDTPYKIVIGKGGTSTIDGQATTAFENIANGGKGGTAMTGGDGGSGGGSGGYSSDIAAGNGGSDGTNGTNEYYGGNGQVTTTREFGEETGILYSGGGGGGAGISAINTYGTNGIGGLGGGGKGGYAGMGEYAKQNTGGGGGGGSPHNSYGGKGGSGIVVIRNIR